ncbi:MAG: dihydroorotate dehydrogenase electron transfer subunit [Candidatus Bathyarchaeia archaeon]
MMSSVCPKGTSPSLAVDYRRTVRIEAIEDEGPRTRSLYFRDPLCRGAKPGQYLMVWVHGVDEVPMSLSTIDRGGLSGFTVAKVGEATEALYHKEIGDIIGLRGPLGRSFTIPKGRSILVGGGIGAAPLVPLAEELALRGLETIFILGARRKEDLLFLERLRNAFLGTKSSLLIATEDGSCGLRGTTISVLEGLLPLKDVERIYACGPQAMIAKLLCMADKYGLRVEASLEAYIKCAVGLCGSCCLGPFRVCVDGPVFNEEELRLIPELGLYRRSASGARIPLDIDAS